MADNTRSRWVKPDPQATPGGVHRFVMSIDYRKVVKAGSNTAMDTVRDNTSPAITVISEDDPRFQGVFNEMFKKPHEELKKHKYPYSPRDSMFVLVPVQ